MFHILTPVYPPFSLASVSLTFCPQVFVYQEGRFHVAVHVYVESSSESAGVSVCFSTFSAIDVLLL